jgi:hypothetical protein
MLEAKAALAIRGLAHRTDVAGNGESGCAPSFSSPHIAPRTITSTRHWSATMPTQRSRTDIELIDRPLRDSEARGRGRGAISGQQGIWFNSFLAAAG